MKRSLKDLRILNTRPKDQAKELNQYIKDAQGIPISCPALEIQANLNHWIELLPDLNNVDHAIFISANAVTYCFRQLRQNHITWPTTINVIAIGKGSAKALHQFNIHVNNIPDTPDSEHLLALESVQHINHQTVLLFKGQGGRQTIEEGLRLRGAKVITLSVYRRIMPEVHREFIHSLWRDNAVDIILLTSVQSIHNLFNMFGENARPWLQNKPCMVISARLAQSASLLGIKNIIISHPDRVMETLFDYYKGLIHGQ